MSWLSGTGLPVYLGILGSQVVSAATFNFFFNVRAGDQMGLYLHGSLLNPSLDETSAWGFALRGEGLAEGLFSSLTPLQSFEEAKRGIRSARKFRFF